MIGTDNDVSVIVYDIGIAPAVKACYRKNVAVLADGISCEEYAEHFIF